MDHIDSVYCINLRRRRDRLSSFLKRFPKDWLPKLRILGAVDGQNHELTKEERLSLHSANWEIEKGRGQWGCSLSHVAIWNEIVKHNREMSIVLEDDAVFSGRHDILSEAITSMKKTGLPLIYAGPDNHPENSPRNPHRFDREFAHRICKFNQNLGSMSYIITKGAAIDLLKIIEKRGHYTCIDHIINEYVKTESTWTCIAPPVFSLDPAGGSDIPPTGWWPVKRA